MNKKLLILGFESSNEKKRIVKKLNCDYFTRRGNLNCFFLYEIENFKSNELQKNFSNIYFGMMLIFKREKNTIYI